MGSGSVTQGVVLVNMVSSVNLHARGAKFVEKLSVGIVDEAEAQILPIIEG